MGKFSARSPQNYLRNFPKTMRIDELGRKNPWRPPNLPEFERMIHQTERDSLAKHNIW